jgi:hypothetical protein
MQTDCKFYGGEVKKEIPCHCVVKRFAAFVKCLENGKEIRDILCRKTCPFYEQKEQKEKSK